MLPAHMDRHHNVARAMRCFPAIIPLTKMTNGKQSVITIQTHCTYYVSVSTQPSDIVEYARSGQESQDCCCTLNDCPCHVGMEMNSTFGSKEILNSSISTKRSIHID